MDNGWLAYTDVSRRVLNESIRLIWHFLRPSS